MIAGKRLVMAALFVAAAGLGSVLHAQQRAQVDIGFAFVANGQPMAPGTYLLEVGESGPVTLTANATGTRVLMMVTTRLGRHDDHAQTELIFDKIGGQFHLSEAWFRGQDGYLLLGTKENHDHFVLRGGTPQK